MYGVFAALTSAIRAPCLMSVISSADLIVRIHLPNRRPANAKFVGLRLLAEQASVSASFKS